MHARVSRVILHPGKIDEAMAVLHDHGLPALREAEGFVGGLWLYDPQTLRGIQIVHWESEADLARWGETGAGHETARLLEPLLAEISPPESFVALHHERGPEASGATHAVVVAPPPRPGTEEEAMGVWRAAVLPALQRQPGYAGGTVLLDRATNLVLDITLWTSAAAMRAATQNAELGAATARTAPYLTGEPTAHEYEVRHQE